MVYFLFEILIGCNIGFVVVDVYNFFGVIMFVVIVVDGMLVSCIDINFDVGVNGEYFVNGGLVVVIGVIVGDF